MIVFFNGEFVPEEKAMVSVFDRGFLYGDGLFEAVRIIGGRPFHWQDHLRRLAQGLGVLNLTLPYSFGELERLAIRLIELNRLPDAILRLTISRGVSPPGYSPKGASSPMVVMSLRSSQAMNAHAPLRWRVIISSVRLGASDPLAGFKTANKLRQVLARAEADAAQADDAILLNTNGHIAEGTSSNIFWVRNGIVYTPALPAGPLPGVTRSLVIGLCKKMRIPVRETLTRPGALHQAEGVFLTMTSLGIVEVEAVDGRRTGRSPLTKALYQALYALRNAKT